MKSICIKHPNVLKHFQKMLLDKNTQAIRVLFEAPEFFDNSLFIDDVKQHDESPPTGSVADDNANDDKLKSLLIGMDDVSDDDFATSFDIISCLHDQDNSPVVTNWTLVDKSIRSIADCLLADQSVQHLSHGNIPRVQVDGGADRSITPHCVNWCIIFISQIHQRVTKHT
jgi:hypothetical protein